MQPGAGEFFSLGRTGGSFVLYNGSRNEAERGAGWTASTRFNLFGHFLINDSCRGPCRCHLTRGIVVTGCVRLAGL